MGNFADHAPGRGRVWHPIYAANAIEPEANQRFTLSVVTPTGTPDLLDLNETHCATIPDKEPPARTTEVQLSSFWPRRPSLPDEVTQP
jgi:hypothetical protein